MGYSSPLGKPKKSGPSPVAKKAAKKVSAKKAPSKKAASKAKNDIPDPDFRGKVYNKKGGITKSYKDSVMRRSAGDY
jgi:hypothetical protein